MAEDKTRLSACERTGRQPRMDFFNGLSVRGSQFFDPVVPAVRANHGQEHGVGSLVIARSVFELYAVDFYGAGIAHRVEKALSTQVGSAGFKAGDGQASGQITFQRNEPGFSPGGRTRRGRCGIEPPGECFHHTGEERPV